MLSTPSPTGDYQQPSANTRTFKHKPYALLASAAAHISQVAAKSHRLHLNPAAAALVTPNPAQQPQVHPPWHSIHREFLQDGQALEMPNCHLRPQVVGFEQGCAVATDGQVDQPVASRVAVNEAGQVVCHASVYSPLQEKGQGAAASSGERSVQEQVAVGGIPGLYTCCIGSAEHNCGGPTIQGECHSQRIMPGGPVAANYQTKQTTMVKPQQLKSTQTNACITSPLDYLPGLPTVPCSQPTWCLPKDHLPQVLGC